MCVWFHYSERDCIYDMELLKRLSPSTLFDSDSDSDSIEKSYSSEFDNFAQLECEDRQSHSASKISLQPVVLDQEQIEELVTQKF